MSHLRGVAFDRAYAANELRYHRAVNGLVATTFIPKIANKDAKAAFEGALVIFTAHEQHAEMGRGERRRRERLQPCRGGARGQCRDLRPHVHVRAVARPNGRHSPLSAPSHYDGVH